MRGRRRKGGGLEHDVHKYVHICVRACKTRDSRKERRGEEMS